MTKSKQASPLATELRKMKSIVTGKNYQISIALPCAFQNDDATKIEPLDKWPVIYVLDPNWFFGMITDVVRYMSWCGQTTDAIVVGIGYPKQKSLQETWRKSLAARTFELTPWHSAEGDKLNTEWLKLRVKTGGGADFFKFIKQELIPFIEEEYPANPTKRILVGHSYGGLFTLFAMFQEPRLFRSYIASSSSLDFAENSMFTVESEYAKKHKKLPVQLYLSAGELEEDSEGTTLTNMYRFAACLEGRNYKEFSLTKQVFLDSNHCDVVAPAFRAGLKMALKK